MTVFQAGFLYYKVLRCPGLSRRGNALIYIFYHPYCFYLNMQCLLFQVYSMIYLVSPKNELPFILIPLK